MALVKATFANGVEWVYDTDVNAHATHYGDADGIQHAMVSAVFVPDGTPLGFTEPDSPAAVEDTGPGTGAHQAALARIAELEAELEAARNAALVN